MLKRIFKSILSLILVISTVFFVQHLKKGYVKESIIKKINSKIASNYYISNNIKRYVNNRRISPYTEKMPSSFKLVYEIDFECSRCSLDMKEIHNFYMELSEIRKIEFCLITTIKSYSYIKFQIDRSLENYDLWAVQQKFTDDNIKLYLLDASNNIIMAGDITIYPFLKDEYVKRLKE